MPDSVFWRVLSFVLRWQKRSVSIVVSWLLTSQRRICKYPTPTYAVCTYVMYVMRTRHSFFKSHLCSCRSIPFDSRDHKNKYGLAVALAQIIAQRAAQDNFQLVIITHDEEFVSMMKQELASQTGFDMPDKYFQVSREQSSDGVYYSKIRSIDWDEI